MLTPDSSVVHLSCITATIPRINCFIADVQTRQAGLALTQKDYDSYVKSGDHNGSSGGGGSKNWSRGKKNDARSVLGSFRPDAPNEQHNDTRGGDEIEMDVRDNVETGSQSSLQRYVRCCSADRESTGCVCANWGLLDGLRARSQTLFVH